MWKCKVLKLPVSLGSVFVVTSTTVRRNTEVGGEKSTTFIKMLFFCVEFETTQCLRNISIVQSRISWDPMFGILTFFVFINFHTTFWTFLAGSNESGRECDWRFGFLHSPTAAKITLSSIMLFRWSCLFSYSINFGVQAHFCYTVTANFHDSFAFGGYFVFNLYDSWKELDILRWKLILMFVTFLSVPINHEDVYTSLFWRSADRASQYIYLSN